MVMELFESLLHEVSEELGIPDLKPDRNNACLIKLPNNGPKIQIELDANNFLIMGTELGFLPAGRYRETVFREALKANGLPHPHVGEFSYSKKTENLCLMTKMPTKNLTGSKIATAFGQLADKAAIWKEAIEKGEVPSILSTYSSRASGTGMFGL